MDACQELLGLVEEIRTSVKLALQARCIEPPVEFDFYLNTSAYYPGLLKHYGSRGAVMVEIVKKLPQLVLCCSEPGGTVATFRLREKVPKDRALRVSISPSKEYFLQA